MQPKSPQTAASLIQPPGEALRPTLNERRSAAHRSDPAWRRQGQSGTADGRPGVAAGGPPQRIRARQAELHPAASCHVRTRRRIPAD